MQNRYLTIFKFNNKSIGLDDRVWTFDRCRDAKSIENRKCIVVGIASLSHHPIPF